MTKTHTEFEWVTQERGYNIPRLQAGDVVMWPGEQPKSKLGSRTHIGVVVAIVPPNEYPQEYAKDPYYVNTSKSRESDLARMEERKAAGQPYRTCTPRQHQSYLIEEVSTDHPGSQHSQNELLYPRTHSIVPCFDQKLEWVVTMMWDGRAVRRSEGSKEAYQISLYAVTNTEGRHPYTHEYVRKAYEESARLRDEELERRAAGRSSTTTPPEQNEAVTEGSPDQDVQEGSGIVVGAGLHPVVEAGEDHIPEIVYEPEDIGAKQPGTAPSARPLRIVHVRANYTYGGHVPLSRRKASNDEKLLRACILANSGSEAEIDQLEVTEFVGASEEPLDVEVSRLLPLLDSIRPVVVFTQEPMCLLAAAHNTALLKKEKGVPAWAASYIAATHAGAVFFHPKHLLRRSDGTVDVYRQGLLENNYPGDCIKMVRALGLSDSRSLIDAFEWARLLAEGKPHAVRIE